jgi:GNAT superfamily N-acetyltransferase
LGAVTTLPEELQPWAADAVLSDGGTVHVRPILPTDGDLLRGLHGRLSAESIYYRFFSPRPKLTDVEVERFTHVDYSDRMAFVALLGEEFLGVARYDRYPGTADAEVAFTVDDAHQGRGISTLLLEHLAVYARQRDITGFTASVLPDNRKMLGVFRSAGFKVKNQYADGIIDVTIDIAPTA